MLLVPQPPEFSTYDYEGERKAGSDEMALLTEGADAVPAKEHRETPHKHFRLVSIGKKQLPNPEGRREQGGRSKGVFWAAITDVGDNLNDVEQGLGAKTRETKTRGTVYLHLLTQPPHDFYLLLGTRHDAPCRLAGRGAYAIVNNEPRVPSQRETHLGYHLSHPSDMGEVQTALGLHIASSFVVQVKNPLAPTTGGQRVGLFASQRVEYPKWIMEDIFGQGGKKGREDFGLRFAPVETIDMLDFEGVELLMIASRVGDEGLEESLGEGRGKGLGVA